MPYEIKELPFTPEFAILFEITLIFLFFTFFMVASNIPLDILRQPTFLPEALYFAASVYVLYFVATAMFDKKRHTKEKALHKPSRFAKGFFDTDYFSY